MPWVNKKPITRACGHFGLPPLSGGADFAEGSVYACDECGEEFVYLIKYDIPVWFGISSGVKVYQARPTGA